MALDDYDPHTNRSVPTNITGYGMNDVNVHYLQSVLVPELCCVRKPTPMPIQTAIGRTVTTIPLLVNASGNGALMIYPRAFNLTTFAAQYNDAAFNPITGAIPGLGNPTLVNGPF